MVSEYIPFEHFQETDDDHTSVRIRDMPYGKQREALEIYPPELKFKHTMFGKISTSETLLLSNVGYDNVPIQGIQVVGDFIYNGPTLTQVKIGETIALYVAFHPQVTGPATGGLYVTAPNAVGGKFATLSGSGVLSEDNSMQYPLLANKGVTGSPTNIANGIYAFEVTGTFNGASAQLQWRTDSSGSWLDIPGAKADAANTIYGIPLNTGQARALINDPHSTTSLTITLKW